MSGGVVFILAALTSAITPAAPIKPQTWVTNTDYPDSLRKMTGTVETVLIVDAMGKTTGCSIIGSSGFTELDRLTCAIFLKRSRFKAARDDTGQPIPGLFRMRFSWRAPGTYQLPKLPEPDIQLTVSKLPKLGSRTALQVWLQMSSSKTPEVCKLDPSERDPQLEFVVCSAVMRMRDLPAVTDATGTPVRGVLSLSVGFSLAAR